MEAQVIIRAVFILVKDKLICVSMKHNNFPYHIEGRLRGTALLTAYLRHMHRTMRSLSCLRVRAFSSLNKPKRPGKSISGTHFFDTCSIYHVIFSTRYNIAYKLSTAKNSWFDRFLDVGFTDRGKAVNRKSSVGPG